MLKYRIVSAIFLLSALGAAIFVPGTVGALLFGILSLLMMAAGMNEFFSMYNNIGIKGYRRLAMSMAVVYMSVLVLPSFTEIPAELPLAELVMALLIFIGFVRVMRSPDLKVGLQRHIVTLGGFFYIAWSLSFIPRIYFIGGPDDMRGRYLLLFLILVTKFSDIGAYTTGMSCNQIRPGKNHKIAPRLSPGKSWEGFFGGIAFSIAIAFALRFAFSDYLSTSSGQELITPLIAVLFGIMAGTLGFLGDVAESVLKRSTECKDSGSILPGMGGILDVLDSLVFVTPLFYFFLKMKM